MRLTGISIALTMAHEIGDDVTEARLRAHVEEHCEPRFFGNEKDRFGFFFGWGGRYPRGQQSALLTVPEVGGRGAWSRWSNDANLAKFAAPTGVPRPLRRRGTRARHRDAHRRRRRAGCAEPGGDRRGRELSLLLTSPRSVVRLRSGRAAA